MPSASTAARTRGSQSTRSSSRPLGRVRLEAGLGLGGRMAAELRDAPSGRDDSNRSRASVSDRIRHGLASARLAVEVTPIDDARRAAADRVQKASPARLDQNGPNRLMDVLDAGASRGASAPGGRPGETAQAVPRPRPPPPCNSPRPPRRAEPIRRRGRSIPTGRRGARRPGPAASAPSRRPPRPPASAPSRWRSSRSPGRVRARSPRLTPLLRPKSSALTTSTRLTGRRAPPAPEALPASRGHAPAEASTRATSPATGSRGAVGRPSRSARRRSRAGGRSSARRYASTRSAASPPPAARASSAARSRTPRPTPASSQSRAHTRSSPTRTFEA